MDVLRETIQTIGAVAAAIILVLRFSGELHRVRCRANFVEYASPAWNETDEGGNIRASIHNLGREVQIASAHIELAGYGLNPQGVTFPITLKRGEHLRIARDLMDLERGMDEIVQLYRMSPLRYEDLHKVHGRFECGEGHQHIAKLDPDSRERLRKYLEKNRKPTGPGTPAP